MAQPEEPLYDFPLPGTEHQWAGHQRGQGSLRSISILDRLLLTLPVWLQLSINPATALHILQREPPGSFLVRKSRTSQRSVLCVRLADDSVPSFVQQFGIREEHATVCLEKSAINFPDLPRLIAFYCVSKDVLPFNLELPEAIAKATSHKELESISHMGVEFWSSQLNFRGPREARKAQKYEKNTEPIGAPLSAAFSQTSSATQKPPKPDPTSEREDKSQTNAATDKSTLFQEFCPIRTRSPRELNWGSDLGTLCFVNPLFPQSHDALHRRHVFKRSHKVRVSTETSSPLSPPLDPPPPPPLMAKTKGRCKARQQAAVLPKKGPCPTGCETQAHPSQFTQTDPSSVGAQLQPLAQGEPVPQPSQFLPQIQEQDQMHVDPEGVQAAQSPTPTKMKHLSDYSDYRQPSPKVNFTLAPSLFPPLSPRTSPSHLARISPFPYPYDSPGASPSLSPYQSPCPSPKAPFPLSPFTSPSTSPLVEDYRTPTPPLLPDQRSKEGDVQEVVDEEKEDEDETDEQSDGEKDEEKEEIGLLLTQFFPLALNDTGSCGSLSSLEEAAVTPPTSILQVDAGISTGPP